MSAENFDAIVPVIKKFAAIHLRCPDAQAVALVLAWWAWHIAPDKRHLPPSVWAKVGVRHALAGRDLPGIRSKFRDAWDHLDQWQGAGMDNVADRKPGPLHAAIALEEVERFFDSLDDFEREMCELLSQGLPNQEVARRMNRTPGAISQRRRRLADRYATQ